MAQIIRSCKGCKHCLGFNAPWLAFQCRKDYSLYTEVALNEMNCSMFEQEAKKSKKSE